MAIRCALPPQLVVVTLPVLRLVVESDGLDVLGVWVPPTEAADAVGSWLYANEEQCHGYTKVFQEHRLTQ